MGIKSAPGPKPRPTPRPGGQAEKYATLVAELRGLAKTGMLVFSRDLTAILDAHEKEGSDGR